MFCQYYLSVDRKKSAIWLSLWHNNGMVERKTGNHDEAVAKPKVNVLQRLIQRITAMHWASRFITRRLHRWDRWVYRVTRGRWTATEILAGLPVIFITTLGSKSGNKRTTPLLAIQEGEDFILVATKFGADHHPDWYFNLKVNTRVEVLHSGKTSTYLARELEGDERDRYWTRAVEHYPGYRSYERLAVNRVIPVIRLTPHTP